MHNKEHVISGSHQLKTIVEHWTYRQKCRIGARKTDGPSMPQKHEESNNHVAGRKADSPKIIHSSLPGEVISGANEFA